MATGATPPACPTCNGNGWLFSLPRGMNAFELGAEGIARNARKVSCWRCAVDRRASGTEAALREALEKIKHSIVHAVGTGKPKAVKAFEEIWTLADAALSPHAKE